MLTYIRNITTTTALQIYRFIRYGAFFITAVLLAQLHISQENIGSYEWMLHLTYTLSFFWVHGFSQSFLIKSGKADSEKIGQLSRSLWGLTITISLTLFVLLWFLGDKGSFLLLGIEEVAYWDLYLYLILLGLPPMVFEYFLIGRQHTFHLIIWGVASNLLHLLCSILPFIYGFGLEGMLWAHIVLNAARTVYMAFILGRPLFSLSIRDEWKGALQLSVYTILGGLPVAFDTWLVGFHTQAEEQVAIFRYGARELPLIMILLGSIHIGLLSTISASGEGMEYLKKKVLETMHWLGPLAVALLFASPYIYPWLFSEAFGESAYIFNIYLLILLSRWILSHTVAMAYEEYRTMNWIALTEFSLNVVLSFIWIEKYGLPGVIYATIVAYLFEKIALMTFLYIKHGISPGQYIPLRAYGIYSILLISSFIISTIWLF